MGTLITRSVDRSIKDRKLETKAEGAVSRDLKKLLQEFVNYDDSASVCSEPSTLPTPAPEPEDGCVWKRGPIVECPE